MKNEKKARCEKARIELSTHEDENEITSYMLRPINLDVIAGIVSTSFHSINQRWRGDAKAKVTSSGWPMSRSVSV